MSKERNNEICLITTILYLLSTSRWSEHNFNLYKISLDIEEYIVFTCIRL